MEQQLLDRLTGEDREALQEVARLLNAAQAAWARIDSGKQCELNEVHNEDTSLAHCLRWGTQSAEELVEMTADKRCTVRPGR